MASPHSMVRAVIRRRNGTRPERGSARLWLALSVREVVRHQLGQEREQAAGAGWRRHAVGLGPNAVWRMRHRDADARRPNHLEVVFLIADRDRPLERDLETPREQFERTTFGRGR